MVDEDDGFCPKRSDKTHCGCWWDGEECCACGASADHDNLVDIEEKNMREITTHHDGHGLAEAIEIEADEKGPGGASHKYHVYVDISGTTRAIESGCTGQAREKVAEIQYQMGPRHEPGSTPGVLDSVLLAIVRDRMEAFQAGPYASPYNADVLNDVKSAMLALKRRADERAARGVLGKNIK